jgi:hypothetical protein
MTEGKDPRERPSTEELDRLHEAALKENREWHDRRSGIEEAGAEQQVHDERAFGERHGDIADLERERRSGRDRRSEPGESTGGESEYERLRRERFGDTPPPRPPKE